MINLEANLTPAVPSLARRLRAAQARTSKAENTAVRVEGFRLRSELKKEIRAGSPGGRQFAPLSIIARYRYGSRRSNNPLFKLARAVGYEVSDNDPFSLKIGFVGRASSVTWRRLAKMHQEGFDTSDQAPAYRNAHISIRQGLTRRGAEVDHKAFGRKRARRRNVFFLRKSTTRLKTPARPIIDPFWSAHRREAARNIRDNFRRKMRGERI